LRRRVEFRHGPALRRQPGREDAPIPLAGDDLPAVARQLVGQILGIADIQDVRRGRVPQISGRKRDRGQQRLQVARRQVDDEPPDLAGMHCGELGRDDLDMSAECEGGLRVQTVATRPHDPACGKQPCGPSALVGVRAPC
jgi:hypothetical protein